MESTISVIVPVHNSESTIGATLKSIIQSIGPNDEIIIVDDASTDRTVQILSKFSQCKLVKISKNVGAASARNRGAELAQKELIFFIDSDVVIKKSHVDKLRLYFDQHKEIQTVTTSVDSLVSARGFFSKFKNTYMEFIMSPCEKKVNYVYGCFCGTRRDGYVRWPEGIRLTEDSMWGFRQSQLGLIIHAVKDIKIVHMKQYTMMSLIKNDFLISSYFSRSFILENRWKTIWSNEHFGHVSKKQKMSVALAVIIFLTSWYNINIGLAMFFIWFMLNLELFAFLYKKRGLIFSFASLIWYYFDNIVYSLGIIHGLILGFKLMKKSKVQK